MAVKIMNTMRHSPLKIAIFSVIGIVSLLGQGLAFAPMKFAPLLKVLPAWGNLTLGMGLCLLSLLTLALIFRLWQLENFTNWMLLAIQAVSVFGVFFLMDGFASHLPESSFLFTGILTMLTVVGIFINNNPDAAPLSPPTIEPTLPVKEIVEIEVPEEPVPYAESKTRVLREQVDLVTRNLGAEKHRTSQLTFLNELSQQLESELDPPVAAQLAVNMLEHALNCSVVSLFIHEQETREFVALATAGHSANSIPAGYRQSSEKGLLGRVARLKKPQLVNDVSTDPDFIRVNNEKTAAVLIVPMMHNGQIKGVMEVCSEKLHAFTTADVHILEGVSLELMRAWERSSYNQRISELIQAGISLTILLDPQTAVQEIAILARKTLEARFVFITLLDQQGNFSRTAFSGEAPKLLQSLSTNSSQEPIIQAALNAVKPFRVREVRKYANAKNLEIDHGGLRSAMAIPIRLHRLSIGAILVFGKQEGVYFSEKDESLADLLASQAAASIESSWLYQELRTTLSALSQLYQLSLDVTQTEDLQRAAELIVQAAYKVSNAREAGIILLSKDGQVEAEAELDTEGFHSRRRHPMDMINQAIEIKQSIFVPEEKGIYTMVAYPLLTNARTLGGLWIDVPDRGQNYANIQMLANQAAVTLERSIWLSESRRQAKQIEAAYQQLQETYDQTLSALMSALDARDRETEGHSTRVSRLATMMGEKLGLDAEQLKSLERGALLHDIGKIGISDTILHKPGKLTDDEWRIMRTHPDIGSRIVDRIPFLQDCMPVVHYHHERWDGSGYPHGLKGTDIPLFARIFAVADVFDALTSKRSYRKSSSPDEALEYLREQANILFDSEVVEALALLPYADLTETEKAPS